MTRTPQHILTTVILAMSSFTAAAQTSPNQDALTTHPAAEQLTNVFKNPAPASWTTSGVTKANYLKLIAANVDYFKQFQNDAGAIIDPFQKREIQYSTPAFALAGGLLAAQGNRADLLEPAIRALSCSITALVQRKAAESHPDFYIPLIMRAYGVLKDAAPAETRKAWETQLRSITPEKIYRQDLKHMNWNIVSNSGELLRRKAGLVDEAAKDAQWSYIESSLAGHEKNFSPVGLYVDPGVPLAYDQFSRIWLEDMMAASAYEGKLAPTITSFLRKGSLSTLLMLSPSGEWPSGGRSALHQWNEAETILICEINANYWKTTHPEIAGAFKRAAHLAQQSMARWQRPSGELNIVKNRFEPTARHGYEGYSHHSQYNLLAMAMLAIAHTHADDAIPEAATPAERGGYVFDLRETFHKVIAAAGGHYILIDTAADPHYNATGLQRSH